METFRRLGAWRLGVFKYNDLMSQIYVAFDLETTGLDPKRDAIIEIGCAKLRDGEIIDQYSTLVNPRRKLPFMITQLTGIGDRELMTAPGIDAVLGPLTRFIGPAPMIAHNVSFDIGFLRAAGLSFANALIDTFEVASIVLPGRSSYSLSALAAEMGIPQAHAHRALEDARVTALLFAALQAQAAKLPLPALIEINRMAAQSNWGLRTFFVDAEKLAARGVFLRTYERQALEAGGLEPLLSPAARQRPRGDGQLEEAETVEPVDVELLAEFLGPRGPLAASLPGYEYREPQIEMLTAVAEAFNNGDHLMIEAGTGTGKSVAYLLPAIAWALQNRRRVVISTNTINLQDQLYTKDIPDLVQVFREWCARRLAAQDSDRFQAFACQASTLRVALMKGRSNYLCQRRLDTLRTRTDLSDDELRVLARIMVWLGKTETGDRAELFLWGPREEAVWARIASESGGCTTKRCEEQEQRRCFFYRNRLAGEAAHLVIVNHALLLSNAAANDQVLPEYSHVIIDEAHHLEDAMTQQLSFSASQPELERFLNSLYTEGGQGSGGLLGEIMQGFLKSELDRQVSLPLQESVLAAQRACEDTRDLLRQFFNVLAEVLSIDQASMGFYGARIRLDRKVRSQPAWAQMEIAWDALSGPLYALVEALTPLNTGLLELQESRTPVMANESAELSAALERLMELYTQFEAAVSKPEENGIYWAEVTGNDQVLSLHAAPLHVGPLVEQHLFMKKENVILTSATLRTAGSYTYIQDRLHAREARTETVGSPFDYKSSTLVFVPTDIGDPNGPQFQRYVEDAIRQLALALDGRTMALFTSNQQLRQTAESLGPVLASAGMTVFQQGSGGSRRQLLENFRNTPRSVLLGTRSFWEGVDVVGAALSGLVLVRLPFAVPNDPVVSARSETFEDAFYQYSVPDAILRFRQGFGRLIRSRQDRGVCVILDNRVVTKSYGRLFLESLPESTVQKAPLSSLAGAAKKWLAANES